MKPRQHYTLVCEKCQRVIMLTRRSLTHPRPVRYSRCGSCAMTPKTWNHHRAPLVTR